MSFSKTELDSLLKLINSGDVESLKAEEFDHFQYQGFDPMRIVQSLAKVKKDKNIDDGQFKKDVFKMIAVGMIKGSITDKNIVKMSEEGQKEINVLISEYGIEKGGGRGKSAATITFPRVMATFPDIAVRMVKVIGPKEFGGGPMLSSRLPSSIKVQVFPAVIPRGFDGDAKKMLLTANLCYTMDQSTQISQLKNPDLRPLASDQSKFTIIGHQSPVPSDETRKSVFKTLNLSNECKSIIEVLKDYKEKVDPSFDIMEESVLKEHLKKFE